VAVGLPLRVVMLFDDDGVHALDEVVALHEAARHSAPHARTRTHDKLLWPCAVMYWDSGAEHTHLKSISNTSSMDMPRPLCNAAKVTYKRACMSERSHRGSRREGGGSWPIMDVP
jgi:hypothetical protein